VLTKWSAQPRVGAFLVVSECCNRSIHFCDAYNASSAQFSAVGSLGLYPVMVASYTSIKSMYCYIAARWLDYTVRQIINKHRSHCKLFKRIANK